MSEGELRPEGADDPLGGADRTESSPDVREIAEGDEGDGGESVEDASTIPPP